ncbi:MAG: metallophosphoesterase family protein [Candidatus Heteroscillospira sp.]
MKIAVFSDSHGDVDTMLSAVRAWQPDLILHLGDHALDAEELAGECGISVRRVRGNCDLASRAPDSDMFELEGVRILMCHGHRHRVKLGLDAMLNAAYFSHADVVLYGHTHVSDLQHHGDMLVINPGSVGTGSHPSWAKLELDGGEIQAEIVPIEF